MKEHNGGTSILRWTPFTNTFQTYQFTNNISASDGRLPGRQQYQNLLHLHRRHDYFWKGVWRALGDSILGIPDREASLKLAQLTREFCKRKVKYVRHILSEAGIIIDQQKTEKVVNWTKPTTPENIRRCLGFVGNTKHSSII